MEGHLPTLITDLALILVTGAVTTIIFKKIKQPLVLGYIIAGFLVGPYFTYIPNVVEIDNVETWAKIGVIFLLFSLGLEFSFKKLVNVGGAATITAMVEIVSIVTIGYYAGKWMGWGTMDSIFLGGLLASSSTTIIIRAFDELGLKRKKFATIVVGVLIVEDIVVILLMVLLSTMAVSQQFDGMELVFSLAKLLFFLIAWYMGGILLIPSFLRRIRKSLDDETLLIISMGLCLGMVYIADQAGFSIELGAFLMGTILAETVFAEKIEHILQPVKTLFATIFFVSIGMMINPAIMKEHSGAIFVITMITIFGKLIMTTLGAIMSGQPLKQSVQVGMSMAQIGEFAFIVASLGLALGVTSDFLFPVAVGASAITTFTTPYLIKLSEPAYNLLIKILPQKVTDGIDRYSSDTQHIENENRWKKLFKSLAINLVTNIVVIIALILISKNFLLTFLNDYFSYFVSKIVAFIITLIASLPFLWALIGHRPAKTSMLQLWSENPKNRGALILILIVKYVIVAFIIFFMFNRFFSDIIGSTIVVGVTLIGLYFLYTKFQYFYNLIIKQFKFNFNERDIIQSEEKETAKAEKVVVTWDNTHISDVEIPYGVSCLGKKLIDLNWRSNYDINIAYIKRGEKLIQIPRRNEMIYPLDVLGVIGTDEQIQNFETYLQNEEKKVMDYNPDDDDVMNIILEKILITENSPLNGKTLVDIKEKINGITTSIERDGKTIYNPEYGMVVELDDYITVVGNKKRIKAFLARTTEEVAVKN